MMDFLLRIIHHCLHSSHPTTIPPETNNKETFKEINEGKKQDIFVLSLLSEFHNLHITSNSGFLSLFLFLLAGDHSGSFFSANVTSVINHHQKKKSRERERYDGADSNFTRHFYWGKKLQKGH